MKIRTPLLSIIGMLLSCVVMRAQTHLYPETDVASVTSYSSAWAATPGVTGSSLTIAFQNNPGAGPAVWMNATTADWTRAQGFVVDISNPSPGSIGIVIQVFDASGDSGPNLWVQGSLDPGVSTVWSSSLSTDSSTYGMDAAPPLVIGPGVTTTGVAWFGGTFGLGHVDHFKIQMVSYSGTGVPVINLRSLRISQPATEAAMFTGLMDQFGQYAQGSWTNKVASASDFAARLSQENADLSANPVPSDRDTYGGWAAGPTLASATSGFFSTAQNNGKWWLVTPGGHLFFSVGIQGANPGYFPIGLSGRQYMLAAQPPGGPYNYYDFYAANINQKYPSGAAGWRTQTNARFKSWGMTTIGDYSDGTLDLQHQLPYATEVDVSGGTGLVWISDGADVKVPDPFDDAFSSTVAGTLAPQFNSTTVNDPWCVGYFIDLWETGWPTYNDRYGLAVTVLNNPPTTGKTNCAKVEFVGDLTGKYTGIGSLNSAWGTSFASWSALLSATNWVPASQNAAMTADMAAYVTHFVSAYFQTVHQAFRADDPNHLDLGARFGEPSPEVVAGAKSWMDVMSMDGPGGGSSTFNSSFWQTIALAEGSGKPWLTGAFMAGSTDSGMFQGWGANTRNQWDRGNVFQTYINTLLSTSVFVGAHWYTNVDESLIGDTGSFKENFEEGFVDFCDTPYYPLVNAARAVNATIYKQHSYAGAARSADTNGMSTAVVPGLVEAEAYDSGSNGVAYATASGMAPSTEACSDTGGGLDICNVSSGDYWCYTINAAGAGSYTVALRVSSQYGGGWMHIEDINGVNLSGWLSVPQTGGWQNWTTLNTTVTLRAGSQTLRVVADWLGFNLNNLSFYWMPPEGDYTILNVNSGLNAAPVPYSAQGSGIALALPDNAADQRWHLTPTGGGYYTISSNDRTLNICPATNDWGWWYSAAGGMDAGDHITEWAGSEAWYEQWQLVPSGFSNYTLVNRNSGLAMDVTGGSVSAGVALAQQAVSSSAASQVWSFGYVPGVAYMPVPQSIANPYAPPAAPTGLAATGSNGAVILGWTVSSGTGCNVKRSLTSGSGYITIAGGVTTAVYTDNSVTNGTAYYYVVSAANAFGESANSPEAVATPVGTPTGLIATGGNGTVVLGWTAPAGAASYNVLRSQTSGGGYVTIAGGVTATNYTDNSVSNGTTYYYVVSAVSTNSGSANSSEAGAMPGASAALPAPWAKADVGSPAMTGTSIYEGGAAFVLKGAGSGLGGTADAFQFAFVTTTSTSFSLIARVAAPPGGSTQTGLVMRSGTTAGATMAALVLWPNGASYTAQLASRTSSNGGIAWATPSGTGLAVPQWLKLTRSGSRGRVYTGYVSSDGQTWTTLGSVSSTGIIGSTGTDYCGLMVSSSNTGILAGGTFDNVSVLGWTAPPGAPSGLAASAASQTQINLGWNAGSGATGYQVLRGNSWSGPYIQTGTSATTGYTDTGLSAGTAYYYMVRAISGSGTSGNSTVAGETTFSAAPASLTAAGGNTTAALSWSASAGAAGYNVKRSTVSGSNYVTVMSNTPATSYTVTGLTNWTIYYYVVSAVNAGGEGPNSLQASATPQSPAISGTEQSESTKLTLSGSNTVVAFTSSVAGHTYQLQYIDSLTSGTWTNFGPSQPGTGGNLIFAAPYDSAVPRRFYRLQISQ